MEMGCGGCWHSRTHVNKHKCRSVGTTTDLVNGWPVSKPRNNGGSKKVSSIIALNRPRLDKRFPRTISNKSTSSTNCSVLKRKRRPIWVSMVVPPNIPLHTPSST
ncbi:hypothetical protein Leryth_002267 [Lithospermum erythrorhizon]|nr:hypothetical protein Leryth_002267 [Lithospermum erythrorhizon]